MSDELFPRGTEPLTPSAERPQALKLVVVAGPGFGRELKVGAGTYQVGKDEACELPLPDSAISRVHLTVSALPAALKITDNKSTNGSFVEGARFTVVEAQAGTTIRIGRSALKVVPLGDDSAARSTGDRFGDLLGKSPAMHALFAQLEKISKHESPVIIHGETGSGKELCARAIHTEGPRAKGPFVVCDLAGVSRELVESDLFGHKKGAFTGATADRQGVFELANHGTLFLDEVAEVPMEQQPRLLRVLERKEIKPVGGDTFRPVDVRIVAATHKDLEAEVKAGRFREDLYFRLAVVTVELPPLRERMEDVSLLVDEMLLKMGLSPALVSSATREKLKAYRWPGNVRELRNAVERVVSFGDVQMQKTGDVKLNARVPFKEAKEELVNAFEKDYLVELYRACEGNISRASREAGIDRVHLRKLFRKHGIVSDGDVGSSPTEEPH